MLGFIAVPAGQDVPTAPTIDPPTFVNPSPALAKAQGLALDEHDPALAFEQETTTFAAAVAIVVADPEAWAGACPDCLRVVGLPHDCTGGDGVVREFDAVLMHVDRVRRS